jgi:peptide methionine sulfoxide reductase MsrA
MIVLDSPVLTLTTLLHLVLSTLSSQMHGVKRVVAGYTGGQGNYPTYKNICDHLEALFIEYNPKKVSFKQILQMWRDNDYPWEPESACRHRSAIFPTTQNQIKESVKFVVGLSQTRPNCPLYIDIQPFQRFYQAEDCQQDYVKKQVIAATQQLLAFANNEVPTGLFTIPE